MKKIGYVMIIGGAIGLAAGISQKGKKQWSAPVSALSGVIVVAGLINIFIS